jgi:hypothetical protein
MMGAGVGRDGVLRAAKEKEQSKGQLHERDDHNVGGTAAHFFHVIG